MVVWAQRGCQGVSCSPSWSYGRWGAVDHCPASQERMYHNHWPRKKIKIQNSKCGFCWMCITCALLWSLEIISQIMVKSGTVHTHIRSLSFPNTPAVPLQCLSPNPFPALFCPQPWLPSWFLQPSAFLYVSELIADSLSSLFLITWFQKGAWASLDHFSEIAGRSQMGKVKTSLCREIEKARPDSKFLSCEDNLSPSFLFLQGYVMKSRGMWSGTGTSGGFLRWQQDLVNDANWWHRYGPWFSSSHPGVRREGSWVVGSWAWDCWDPPSFLCLCQCVLTYFLWQPLHFFHCGWKGRLSWFGFHHYVKYS